ncbi:chromosome-associated kinesin [Wolffia australiana]
MADGSESAPRSSAQTAFRSQEILASLAASVSDLRAHYQVYEDAFFKKAKDELLVVREQPTVAFGVAITAGLLLMRGPRRFLIRQTIGRFQDQEAVFAKAVNSTKELEQAAGSVKLETKKLLERASFAEQEILSGRTKLKDTGRQIQNLVNHIRRIETDVQDFMEELREMPDGEALKLRKEVASMGELVRQQKAELEKETMQISELGIRV